MSGKNGRLHPKHTFTPHPARSASWLAGVSPDDGSDRVAEEARNVLRDVMSEPPAARRANDASFRICSEEATAPARTEAVRLRWMSPKEVVRLIALLPKRDRERLLRNLHSRPLNADNTPWLAPDRDAETRPRP
jgi:hypothetical protein